MTFFLVQSNYDKNLYFRGKKSTNLSYIFLKSSNIGKKKMITLYCLPSFCLSCPYSSLLLRGFRATRVESGFSSFVMNNRSTCLGLSRLPSLTSFSGLWKCLTIPLMASPTPSWIWPVFNSGWGKRIRIKRNEELKQLLWNCNCVLSLID